MVLDGTMNEPDNSFADISQPAAALPQLALTPVWSNDYDWQNEELPLFLFGDDDIEEEDMDDDESFDDMDDDFDDDFDDDEDDFEDEEDEDDDYEDEEEDEDYDYEEDVDYDDFDD